VLDTVAHLSTLTLLLDYIDMQDRISRVSSKRIQVYNNNYVGAASYNIFAGVFVAFIFGAAFFFDLFWPARKESRGVRMAWKVCGVLAVIFHLGAALALTVITAKYRCNMSDNHGRTMLGQDEQLYWWRQYSKHDEAQLRYRNNARAVTAVVFAWLGWVSVVPR
jgi:hypothetical protein